MTALQAVPLSNAAAQVSGDQLTLSSDGDATAAVAWSGTQISGDVLLRFRYRKNSPLIEPSSHDLAVFLGAYGEGTPQFPRNVSDWPTRLLTDMASYQSHLVQALLLELGNESDEGGQFALSLYQSGQAPTLIAQGGEAGALLSKQDYQVSLCVAADVVSVIVEREPALLVAHWMVSDVRVAQMLRFMGNVGLLTRPGMSPVAIAARAAPDYLYGADVPLPAAVATQLVSSLDEFDNAVASLPPGSHILLNESGSFAATRELSRAMPNGSTMVIRPATTMLGPKWLGDLLISAPGWIVYGIDFPDNESASPRVRITADNVRLTRCRLTGRARRAIVAVDQPFLQQNVRVDRNEVYGYDCHGLLVTGVNDKTCLVDHNHIHHCSGVGYQGERGVALLIGDNPGCRAYHLADVAYNYVHDHNDTCALLLRASRCAVYRNTIYAVSVLAAQHLSVELGVGNLIAANLLDGGSAIYVRDEDHQVLGNKVMRNASTCLRVWAGTYNPSQFDPSTPSREDNNDVAPRAPAIGCLLAGNALSGEIEIGAYESDEEGQPWPALATLVVATTGTGAVLNSDQFQQLTSYNPILPYPGNVATYQWTRLDDDDTGPYADVGGGGGGTDELPVGRSCVITGLLITQLGDLNAPQADVLSLTPYAYARVTRADGGVDLVFVVKRDGKITKNVDLTWTAVPITSQGSEDEAFTEGTPPSGVMSFDSGERIKAIPVSFAAPPPGAAARLVRLGISSTTPEAVTLSGQDYAIGMSPPNGSLAPASEGKATRGLPVDLGRGNVTYAYPSTLSNVLAEAGPGSVVALYDGVYNARYLIPDGTAEQPVVVTAVTQHGAVLGADAQITLGSHVRLYDLEVRGGGVIGDRTTYPVQIVSVSDVIVQGLNCLGPQAIHVAGSQDYLIQYNTFAYAGDKLTSARDCADVLVWLGASDLLNDTPTLSGRITGNLFASRTGGRDTSDVRVVCETGGCYPDTLLIVDYNLFTSDKGRCVCVSGRGVVIASNVLDGRSGIELLDAAYCYVWGNMIGGDFANVLVRGQGHDLRGNKLTGLRSAFLLAASVYSRGTMQRVGVPATACVLAGNQGRVVLGWHLGSAEAIAKPATGIMLYRHRSAAGELVVSLDDVSTIAVADAVRGLDAAKDVVLSAGIPASLVVPLDIQLTAGDVGATVPPA